MRSGSDKADKRNGILTQHMASLQYASYFAISNRFLPQSVDLRSSKFNGWKCELRLDSIATQCLLVTFPLHCPNFNLPCRVTCLFSQLNRCPLMVGALKMPHDSWLETAVFAYRLYATVRRGHGDWRRMPSCGQRRRTLATISVGLSNKEALRGTTSLAAFGPASSPK